MADTLAVYTILKTVTEIFTPWLLVISVASLASEVRKMRKEADK